MVSNAANVQIQGHLPGHRRARQPRRVLRAAEATNDEPRPGRLPSDVRPAHPPLGVIQSMSNCLFKSSCGDPPMNRAINKNARMTCLSLVMVAACSSQGPGGSVGTGGNSTGSGGSGTAGSGGLNGTGGTTGTGETGGTAEGTGGDANTGGSAGGGSGAGGSPGSRWFASGGGNRRFASGGSNRWTWGQRHWWFRGGRFERKRRVRRYRHGGRRDVCLCCSASCRGREHE